MTGKKRDLWAFISDEDQMEELLEYSISTTPIIL